MYSFNVLFKKHVSRFIYHSYGQMICTSQSWRMPVGSLINYLLAGSLCFHPQSSCSRQALSSSCCLTPEPVEKFCIFTHHLTERHIIYLQYLLSPQRQSIYSYRLLILPSHSPDLRSSFLLTLSINVIC